MTFDIQAIEKSKREMRRKLAALPIIEKLRILDELRARTLTLRAASPASGENIQPKEEK